MRLKELQDDPGRFRAALRIETDTGSPQLLADVADGWQLRDFEALDGAWRAVAARNGSDTNFCRAWLERPRGHSKTSDLAVMTTWALFSSRRAIRGVAAAADKDQARLLRDAILSLVRANTWLSGILDVAVNKVTNRHTGSELSIISSDAPSSYGITPDFVVVDELVHWQSRELWDSLLSSAAKRSRCLLLVISNAGFQDSWQWETREAVRQDPSWYFSRIDGPRASWISEKHLAEQRRLLPDIAFSRLWLNEWSSGSGDALRPEDIDRAVCLNGPMAEPREGWVFCAGLDLGLSRDASALVTIAKHLGHVEEKPQERKLTDRERMLVDAGLLREPTVEPKYVEHPGTGRMKLVAVQLWRPTKNQKVSISAIEEAVLRLNERFNLAGLGIDPWQAALLQEQLRAQGVFCQSVEFTPNNLRSMCTAVLEGFTERQVDLFRHEQLLSDLRSLRVEEKSYGCRLVSPRGPSGHGDAATALAIALHVAKAIENYAPLTVQGPLLVA